MPRGKLLNGELTDLTADDTPRTWDDGGVDVPLVAMPSELGPYIYDAETQTAIRDPSAIVSDTNRSTVTQHLKDEADALRSYRLSTTLPLTNTQRDQAILRLAKDVEYLCRLAAAKFDHAD